MKTLKNGKRMYEDLPKCTIIFLTKNRNIKFRGWYARYANSV